MKYTVKPISNAIFATNSYLIYNDEKEALIIDPSFDPIAIQKAIEELGLKVIGILVTHAHQDHIYSVKYFKDLYQADVWASKGSKDIFTNRIENLSFIGSEHFGLDETILDIPVRIVEEEKPHKIGNFDFTAGIYPGHSRGCTVFDFGELIFTGDFLFKDTIGRLDWPGSKPDDMKNSLLKFKDYYKNKEAIIYPGHNETTTIQRELKNNMFLVNPEYVRNI